MTALVVCLFPPSRMSGRISSARAGGRGVSQAVDWTETGRKPWAVSPDGPREYLPVSVKGAGRPFLPRDSRGHQTDDAPLAWREAGPLARSNSASTKYTEGRRYWPYCASTRPFSRNRGAFHEDEAEAWAFLSFPSALPCASALAFAHVGSKHDFLLQARGTSPLSHVFAHPFSQTCMRILGNVMPESHWRWTPRRQVQHVGAVRKVSCMADINRPRGARGRIGPRSKPATQLVLLHDLDLPMAYLGQLCRRSRSSRAGVLADERWSRRKMCSRLSVLLICTSISCMSQLDTVLSTRRAVSQNAPVGGVFQLLVNVGE